MMIGQSPFNGCDEDELFWSVCNEQPYYPRFLSREAKHVLQLVSEMDGWKSSILESSILHIASFFQLLEKDPSLRLGIAGCSAGDVCDQPFFKPIDFAKLERKDIVPPYRPKLVSLLFSVISTSEHEMRFDHIF